MCLVALALDQHRRFPLVVAANRDEFFARTAAPLDWWTPAEGSVPVLAGRDLDAGGSWMGLTATGRFAVLTNVRDPQRHDPTAPSRGQIVVDWLTRGERTDRFWMRTALSGHNGFNLIAADWAQGECFWASNTEGTTQRLQRGVYGLSNAGLDTPWPKVQALKARVADAVAQGGSVELLATLLFAALTDAEPAPDEALPRTGVGLERERQLSPAFIRTADGRYGTRCSTLLIAERVGRQSVTHVIERTYPVNGGPPRLRRTLLKDWPRIGTDAARPMPPTPITEQFDTFIPGRLTAAA